MQKQNQEDLTKEDLEKVNEWQKYSESIYKKEKRFGFEQRNQHSLVFVG